jgi:hypothetical protein
MKIQARKEHIYERKADGSGRISLPSKEFAGKKLEVVVTDVIEEDGDEG